MIEYIITFRLDKKGDMAVRTRVPSPVQYNGLMGNTGLYGVGQNTGNGKQDSIYILYHWIKNTEKRNNCIIIIVITTAVANVKH